MTIHPVVRAIRDVCEERRISATELSKLSGAAEQSIRAWFRGELSPRLTTLERVCTALDLQICLEYRMEGKPS